MFLYDSDFVLFNRLPNFNIFQEIWVLLRWRYKHYCSDNFQNLPGCIRNLLYLTYQVSYVLCEIKLSGRCVWSLFTHYIAFEASTIWWMRNCPNSNRPVIALTLKHYRLQVKQNSEMDTYVLYWLNNKLDHKQVWECIRCASDYNTVSGLCLVIELCPETGNSDIYSEEKV